MMISSFIARRHTHLSRANAALRVRAKAVPVVSEAPPSEDVGARVRTPCAKASVCIPRPIGSLGQVYWVARSSLLGRSVQSIGSDLLGRSGSLGPVYWSSLLGRSVQSIGSFGPVYWVARSSLSGRTYWVARAGVLHSGDPTGPVCWVARLDRLGERAGPVQTAVTSVSLSREPVLIPP
jgi:hypothetical protein